jgi:ribosomal protein S18 acetylase RimI-like enzyme
MNFYSQDIINDIVDHSDLECIVDKIDEFTAVRNYLFLQYAGMSVSPVYTQFMLTHPNNEYVFYCLADTFDIHNCPCIMAYRRVSTKTEIVYYMLLICTKRRFKGMGYGSKLITEFIEKVKKDTTLSRQTKHVKIVLSSVEQAVTFYEEYGFKWTRKSLADYPILQRYELYDETKEYFIMELEINDI